MKSLFALILLFPFLACGRGAPPPKPPINSTPQSVMLDPGYISVTTNVTATVSRAMRISRLAEAVEQIINTDAFKARVLGAYYKGIPQFYDTELSNAQVYQKIREAAENQTVIDYHAQLIIKTERLGRNVLGRTLVGADWFSFNDRNFDTRKDSGLVGTICHEWIHKLGFIHSANSTAARPYSVPYAVGTICAELYNDLI